MIVPELEDKILSLAALVPLVNKLKVSGKTIVTNNGSYDLMHLGHITGLFEAKRQGDVLIVGLNSDKSIKAYKGEDRPVNDEVMRSHMIAAISAVDYVFLFDETTPLDWLAKLKPDVHTNGAEYGDDCIEKEVVEKNGGCIYLLPILDGYKTTMMIEKIKKISR
jgi:glycerol-3-phosphate cytidylyltransferase